MNKTAYIMGFMRCGCRCFQVSAGWLGSALTFNSRKKAIEWCQNEGCDYTIG